MQQPDRSGITKEEEGGGGEEEEEEEEIYGLFNRGTEGTGTHNAWTQFTYLRATNNTKNDSQSSFLWLAARIRPTGKVAGWFRLNGLIFISVR
jgi:hypothetical protein